MSFHPGDFASGLHHLYFVTCALVVIRVNEYMDGQPETYVMENCTVSSIHQNDTVISGMLINIHNPFIQGFLYQHLCLLQAVGLLMQNVTLTLYHILWQGY